MPLPSTPYPLPSIPVPPSLHFYYYYYIYYIYLYDVCLLFILHLAVLFYKRDLYNVFKYES